jgi:GH15 family glucan-1,4-alpha-glucosidase
LCKVADGSQDDTEESLFQRTKDSKEPLIGQRIGDYAMIGDCETAALVGLNGSIDWLCWPNFSSNACFAGLLGTADHGFWKIAPQGKVKKTSRRYLSDTMIVETTFETSSGVVVQVDFMPPRGKNSDIVRVVRCTKGKVAMRMQLAIRFDYGRTVPWVTHFDGGLRAISGPDMVVLRTAVKLEGEGLETVGEFTLKASR